MDKRRIRRSAEQWADIITLFESCGRSQQAFCDEHGLALTTFQKHQRLVRHTAGGTRSTAGKRFIKVTPRPSNSVPSGLVMHAGGGVEVQMPLTMDIEALARLVRAVRDGC